jgi:hypothetical protein
MLSKEEWNATAERAAAAKYGDRHAAWLRFRRFGAVPTGILVAAAALGLGAWWLFAHVVIPLFSGNGPALGHLPFGFILVAVVALVGTVAAWRVSVPSAPFLIARTLLTVTVWLALAAFGAAMLAS